MFTINSDSSIYVTRGDVAFFNVTAQENGVAYKFQPGDVVRMKVTEKKNCDSVMFQKDFLVEGETETVGIYLSEDETKIGEVISKPTDYWYEIELNPFTNPQTILGYDEDGAKIFKLYPEGRDLVEVIEADDIPIVDDALSLTSVRPVQNQVIARTLNNLNTEIAKVKKESGYDNTQELQDIRKGYDGTVYSSAGEAVRGQIRALDEKVSAVIQTPLVYGPEWESGKIYESDGTIMESSEYEETTEFIELPEGSTITASGTPIRVYSYDIETQAYIGKLVDMSDGDVYTVTEELLVRITAGQKAVPVISGLSIKVRVEILEEKTEKYDTYGERISDVEESLESVVDKDDFAILSTRILHTEAKMQELIGYEKTDKISSWTAGYLDSSSGEVVSDDLSSYTVSDYISLSTGSVITTDGPEDSGITIYSYDVDTQEFIGIYRNMSYEDTLTLSKDLLVRIVNNNVTTVSVTTVNKGRVDDIESRLNEMEARIAELETALA